ncbi:low affinity immunoglobulin epsilon Fc receptor-like [Acropora muricata]|uniref:low affinity immunoglobulin epsilon Fc receptor-like n=1 Tax=Acropora muricata TaxID=159855 RepID=UPI0034E4737E
MRNFGWKTGMAVGKALLILLAYQALSSSVVWSQNCDVTGSSCNCSTGWIRFWERCYIFISNDTTRDKASEACRNYVAKLAMPKTQAMNNFLVDHMTSPMAWLGLSDQGTEGEFKWSDGEKLSSFTSWTAGHPLNSGTDFVKIAKDDGSWYNVGGTETSGYICTKKC